MKLYKRVKELFERTAYNFQERSDVPELIEVLALVVDELPRENSVVISRDKFWEAFAWAISDSPHDAGWSLHDYATAMARRLGLEK